LEFEKTVWGTWVGLGVPRDTAEAVAMLGSLCSTQVSALQGGSLANLYLSLRF